MDTGHPVRTDTSVARALTMSKVELVLEVLGRLVPLVAHPDIGPAVKGHAVLWKIHCRLCGRCYSVRV